MTASRLRRTSGSLSSHLQSAAISGTAAEPWFDWRLARLPHGLQLLTIRRPATATAAVCAFVRAGSRYDPSPVLGQAHMAEHMLFKGTQKTSQREIFGAIERLGGTLDAATTKEYVVLQAVTPEKGMWTAIDILAEVLTEPALREEDFWDEKLVVLREICRAEDQQSVVFDLFAKTLWRTHPLRQPVRGTLGGLYGLTPDSLLSFVRERYVAGNMLLAVAGDIRHEQIRQAVVERFADLPTGPESPPDGLREGRLEGTRTAHLEKGVQQTCLLMGVPTVSLKHEDRSALKVLERVLGMGGSARLYQRLREERQVAYSVNTVTAHYEDAGYFAVLTVCDAHSVREVRQAILEEWDRLRQHRVSPDELEGAKSNYAGTQARRAETNLALASIYGTRGLLHHIETFAESISRINAVVRDDVLRVAQTYLDPERHVLATVGRRVRAPARSAGTNA